VSVERTNSVSSAISKLDRRLHTVESKALGLASSAISSISTPSDVDPTSNKPGSGTQPPKTYKKVIKGYIYGDHVTGNGSRIELYFSEPLVTAIDNDPETGTEITTPMPPGDTFRVQGVHATSDDDFVISPKSFTVLATDTPPWTDPDVRVAGTSGQTRRSWRNTPSTGNNGETVDYTVFFNPVVAVPKTYSSTSGRELITTRRIDTVSATGSTVTVTFNSTNKFKVGDIIYIDNLGSSYTALFGRDGLFKVSEVESTNIIKYELEAPLSTPISAFTPSTFKYVYPVAQPYVEEGEVWIDKSVEPNKVYVWKEYRWYDTADPIGQVTPEKDGVVPSPVTDLAGTSEVPAGSTTPVINLTWTAPTTRSNGDPISGFLDGYDIWYKRSGDPVFKKEFVKDGGAGVNSYQIKDATLIQNATYNIRVYTVDIMSQYSTAATVDVLTAKYSETLNPPSKPLVSSRLGTITVTWDGNDSTGNLPVRGVIYVEYHQSTSSTFTPSSSTLIGTTLPTLGGDYQVVADLNYSTNYYFKLVFVRKLSETELDKSDPSVVSDAIQVAPLVNTDIIANTISGAKIEPGSITASDKIIGNTITGALIQALAIDAGKIAANAITADKIDAGAISAKIISGDVIRTANTGARVELRNTGIYAYNSSNVIALSFDTSTSTLTVGGYATDASVSAVSTVATTANTTANTANTTANSASTTATTANTTANSALSTANSKLDPGNVISQINAIYTPSGTSTTTTIAGGAIRTGTVDGDRITATTAIIFSDGSYSSVIGNGVVSGIPLTTVGMSLRAGATTQRGFLSLYQDGNGVIVGRDTGNRIAFFESGGSYMDLTSNTVNISGGSQVTLGNNLTRVLNNFRIELGALSTTFDIFLDFSAATRAFRVTQTGFTLVGNPSNSSTTATMYVFGRANALGIFADNQPVPSSKRMKTDIRDFKVPESLFNITPKLFKYINSIRYESWPEKPTTEEYSNDSLGAIAEDFVDVGLDYLVTRNDSGKVEGLDYSRISVLLLPAIKELRDRVQKLERENK
jgi:hypothetical protein